MGSKPSSVSRFFRPAIALMNRLKYPQKFFLISILLSAPTAVVIILLTNIRNEAIDFGAKERLGLAYIKPLVKLLSGAQDLRMSVQHVLLRDSVGENQVQAATAALEQDINAVDTLDVALGAALQTTVRWSILKTRWQALREKLLTASARESYAAHTAFIAQIFDLISYTGDVSNLILDPDLDSYYLMDGSLSKLPLLLKYIQLSVDHSERIRSGVSLSATEQAELMYVLPGLVSSTQTDLGRNIDVAYKANPALVSQVGVEYEKSQLAVTSFLNTTEIKTLGADSSDNRADSGGAAKPVFDPQSHISKGREAIAASLRFYDVQAAALDRLLEIRINAFTLQRTLIQVGVPMVLLLVIYLQIGFYRSVMQTVGSLDEISHGLVSGDTTEAVVLEAKDELSQVGEAFNAIGQMLVMRNRELEQSQFRLERSVHQLEDINQQVQEQQTQLIQAEKMSSLGQMVAGIAHEVNTPLGYVRGNIESLMESQELVQNITLRLKGIQGKLMAGEIDDIERLLLDNESFLQEVDDDPVLQSSSLLFSGVIEGIDKIQELVAGLRNFSRLDEAAMKATDINEGIDSALMIAHNATKHVIEIVKHYGRLPLVKCYGSQMNQVFLNLIVNAAHACEKENDSHFRGELVITTRLENEHVLIEFTDNGIGIPQENLERIFEPFFTTKAVGRGTGLGLSIVYKIIEKHNGDITVRSKVGTGTTFRIELPVAVQSAARAVELSEAGFFADEAAKV
ncbi:MAG: GHKL domain-containing protein [Rhizobacter sp.]|nr:GHKL domain-containing protein [Chlorobiales bacterium]